MTTRLTSDLQGGEAGPVRLIPIEGEPEVDLSALGLEEKELRDLYRLMALTRRADLEATALQRQGDWPSIRR